MNNLHKAIQAITVCVLLSAGAVIANERPGTVRAYLDVSRERPFVHEFFDITLRIEIENLRLGREMHISGFPDTDILSLGDFRELSPEQRVEGTRTTEIRRYRTRARAGKPGRLPLSPSLQISILQRHQTAFGMSTWIHEVKRIPVESIQLYVRDIPQAGRPADYTGAVGTFELSAAAHPANVAAGDLVTLRMRIHGEGWLEEVQTPPGVSSGRHFRVYAPEQVEPVRSNERNYEQVVIPQTTNAAAIPAISFSFFDPRRERFINKSAGPFPLNFTREITRPELTVFTPPDTIDPETVRLTPLTWQPFPPSAGDNARAAQQAFENAEPATALNFMRTVFEQNRDSPQARNNLAVALHAAGYHGEAVWHLANLQYTAGRFAPGIDNLGSALHAAGIQSGHWRHPLTDPRRKLNRREWLALAALLAAGGLSGLLTTVGRRLVRPLFSVILLIAAASALMISRQVEQLYRSEAVIMNDITGRLAPWPTSGGLKRFRAGTLVSVAHEEPDGWILVRTDSNSGWLPRSAVCMLNEQPAALRLADNVKSEM